MHELFDRMKEAHGSVHPLIFSSVFHYEFVFIHPFSDGNGRMARLWHTAILSKWKPVFEYIPIESQIEKSRDTYYDAIAKCHAEGNSTIFIEFYTSSFLMEKLGLKSKEGFRRNYLRPAVDMKLMQMTIPDKPNSRNQRYVKI